MATHSLPFKFARCGKDTQPSPLDLLATTCTKVGSPLAEVDRGAAAAGVVSQHLC